MTRILPALRWLLGVTVVLFAGTLLWRQLEGLSMAQLQNAWLATPTSSIVLSVLATALSFACLAGYERFATAHAVPGRVPIGAAFRVGATAHAIANTLGFHAITAGALRYRAYRRFGLRAVEVARVVAMVGVCVAAGVVSIAGLALLALALPTTGSIVGVSIALAAFVALALMPGIWAHTSTGAAVLLRRTLVLCVMGSIEMAASIGALYVLMPAVTMPQPASFVLLFISATLLGIVSHVPGGIGVFEAAMLAALPSDHRADILTALLAYRVIYNLLPFVLSLTTEFFAVLKQTAGEAPGFNWTADKSASPVADAGAGE